MPNRLSWSVSGLTSEKGLPIGLHFHINLRDCLVNGMFIINPRKTLSFRRTFLIKGFLVTHNYIITFDFHLVFYKTYTNLQNILLPVNTITSKFQLISLKPPESSVTSSRQTILTLYHGELLRYHYKMAVSKPISHES